MTTTTISPGNLPPERMQLVSWDDGRGGWVVRDLRLDEYHDLQWAAAKHLMDSPEWFYPVPGSNGELFLRYFEPVN